MKADLTHIRSDRGAIVRALTDAGATIGDRNACRCPFHDDHSASGGIYLKDGIWRYKCNAASCGFGGDVFDVQAKYKKTPVDDVIRAQAAQTAYPTPRPANTHRAPQPTPYDTLDALRASLRDARHVVAHWAYDNPTTGNIDLVVFRTERRGVKKQYPQGHQRADGKFVLGAPAKPWPLYRRDLIATADYVVFVEGEKTADALIAQGYTATTTSCGAGKSEHTDFNPLAHVKTVILCPDNDPPGIAHMQQLGARLAHLFPAIRLSWLSPDALGVPTGGDFADFVAMHADADAGAIHDLIGDVLAVATPFTPPIPTKEQTTGCPTHRSPSIQTPVLTCLADVQPKKVEWLWWQRIAVGKITIFAGEPGLGKSTITLDIAARVSTGYGWPDCSDRPEPGNVILLSAEDDAADTTLPRLLAAGADVKRIHIMPAVHADPNDRETISSFTLTKNLPALEAAIIQLRPRFIVIDPVTAYLGATDSYKNADVRALLAPLAALAARYGVAIMIVTHLNKSSGASAMNRFTGSGAFVAAARAAWVVAKDPADPTGARRLFLPAKNNLGRDSSGLAYSLDDQGEVAVVRWEAGAVTMSADTALAEPHGQPGPEPEKREAAEEWLRRALSTGPRLAIGIHEEAKNAEDISGATLKRAKSSLGVKAYRPKNPGPWFWALPQHMLTTGASAPCAQQPEHLEHVPVNPVPDAHHTHQMLRLSNAGEKSGGASPQKSLSRNAPG